MLCYKKTNIAGENMGSTRKGMLNVLIAAVLWGSSGVCAQYIMEKSQRLRASLRCLMTEKILSP